jgi:hypothetical protein
LELYTIIVTLRDDTPREKQVAFRKEVATWSGVEHSGELQFDPEIPEVPAYFLIYTGGISDRAELMRRLQEAPSVAAVEVPPARFAVGARRGDRVARRLEAVSPHQIK